MRWSWIVLAPALAASAQAAPRVTPFVPVPGIALDAATIGTAFCDSSRRAIVRLEQGELLAIDAAGTVQSLGNAGGRALGPMVCDRRDRVVIGAGKALVVVAGGVATSQPVPAEIRHLRVLDDGAIGIVDDAGAVYRYDTALAPTWTIGRPMSQAIELDGTGDKVIIMAGNRVDVHDRTGRTPGPSAIHATWHDNRTVVFTDRAGRVLRWAIDAPADRATQIGRFPSEGARFVRAVPQRAGRRVIVHRYDGALLVLALDGADATATTISRVPRGSRQIAAGDAPFAVVAIGDRALVVDLARPAFAVAPDRPLVPVDAMAFSPDGRSLAMFGGAGDLLVADVERFAVRRLTTKHGVLGQLRWALDGTLVAGGFAGSVRWGLDGTDEPRGEPAIGFTPHGDPIVARDQRVVIERGRFRREFPLDRGFAAKDAELGARYMLVRGSQRVAVYAVAAPGAPPVLRTHHRSFVRDAVLAGEGGVVFLDETNAVVLADRTGERVLDRFAALARSAALAASGDHSRVAAAADRAVAIWDAHGREVARLTAVGGAVRALAWSPDGRMLAVSTRSGVELWTIPR